MARSVCSMNACHYSLLSLIYTQKLHTCLQMGKRKEEEKKEKKKEKDYETNSDEDYCEPP